MKKLITFSIFLAIVSIVLMGCKKDPDSGLSSANMEAVSLKGKVTDMNGNPVGGVHVTSGSASATTAANGTFSFSKAKVVSDRAIVKFEKDNYFPITRSCVKGKDMFMDAVLYPKGNSTISIESEFNVMDPTTLEINIGRGRSMKVDLKAASVMRADGSNYDKGKVKADMLYLDPNNKNFTSMMPGSDLLGIRDDNSQSMLVSYGMTNVNLADESGNPLQLKTDVPADVTFPIPEGMEKDAPATMPLWHFDDAKGIWIEDGLATLRDGVYVGTVKHFSWVNLDDPKKAVIIKGKVLCEDGKPVSYVKVTANQTSAYTSSTGDYTLMVPENTPVTLQVTANGGSDSQAVPGQPGGTTYNAAPMHVPCSGGGGGGEPGTGTEIDKGAVKYKIDETYIAYTFAEKGKKFRMDVFEDGVSKISQSVTIINHTEKKILVGVNDDDEGFWIDNIPYNIDYPIEMSGPVSIDEKVYADYKQSETVTIAGKQCSVYLFTNDEGVKIKYAVWNGLLMLVEENDELIVIAVSATLKVPNNAFTKTFNVDWLPNGKKK